MARKRRGKAGPIIALVAGGSILAAVIGTIAWVSSTRTELDKNGCPTDGNYPRTAVLIDASDPISQSQKKRISEFLTNDLAQQLEVFEWIGVFVLGEDVAFQPTSFETCYPGDAKDANILIENELARQKSYERFVERLDDALQDLLDTEKSHNSSPILGMIGTIALDRRFDSSQDRRLVLVSDMLQNVAEYSHYAGVPDFDSFRQRDYARDYLELSLNGVDVSVIYLVREWTKDLQTRAHAKFWEDFFRTIGADVTRLEPVR